MCFGQIGLRRQRLQVLLERQNADMKVKVTMVGGGGAGGGGSVSTFSRHGCGGDWRRRWRRRRRGHILCKSAATLATANFTLGGGGMAQPGGCPVDWTQADSSSNGGDTSCNLFSTTYIARGGEGGACGGLTNRLLPRSPRQWCRGAGRHLDSERVALVY